MPCLGREFLVDTRRRKRGGGGGAPRLRISAHAHAHSLDERWWRRRRDGKQPEGKFGCKNVVVVVVVVVVVALSIFCICFVRIVSFHIVMCLSVCVYVCIYTRYIYTNIIYICIKTLPTYKHFMSSGGGTRYTTTHTHFRARLPYGRWTVERAGAVRRCWPPSASVGDSGGARVCQTKMMIKGLLSLFPPTRQPTANVPSNDPGAAGRGQRGGLRAARVLFFSRRGRFDIRLSIPEGGTTCVEMFTSHTGLNKHFSHTDYLSFF